MGGFKFQAVKKEISLENEKGGPCRGPGTPVRGPPYVPNCGSVDSRAKNAAAPGGPKYETGGLGVPYEFCFILTTSLRYVPFMGTSIRCIVDTQRSRGIDLRPRLRNVPHFVALLMPLLVQSFVLAEQLAMAMESRGFARTERTLRKAYQISLMEYGGMGVALGLLVVYGVWGRGLWG